MPGSGAGDQPRGSDTSPRPTNCTGRSPASPRGRADPGPGAIAPGRPEGVRTIYAETLVEPRPGRDARGTKAQVGCARPHRRTHRLVRPARTTSRSCGQPVDPARRQVRMSSRVPLAPSGPPPSSSWSTRLRVWRRAGPVRRHPVRRPGEIVALLGANGSGKSTLVKGMLGLNERLAATVPPLSGSRRGTSEHPRLGYVPQRHTSRPRSGHAVRSWPWPPPPPLVAAAAQAAADTQTIRECSRSSASPTAPSRRQHPLRRTAAARPDRPRPRRPPRRPRHGRAHGRGRHRQPGDPRAASARLADRGTTMLIVTHELEALAEVVTRIVVHLGRADRLRWDACWLRRRARRRPRHPRAPPPRQVDVAIPAADAPTAQGPSTPTLERP